MQLLAVNEMAWLQWQHPGIQSSASSIQVYSQWGWRGLHQQCTHASISFGHMWSSPLCPTSKAHHLPSPHISFPAYALLSSLSRPLVSMKIISKSLSSWESVKPCDSPLLKVLGVETMGHSLKTQDWVGFRSPHLEGAISQSQTGYFKS